MSCHNLTLDAANRTVTIYRPLSKTDPDEIETALITNTLQHYAPADGASAAGTGTYPQN